MKILQVIPAYYPAIVYGGPIFSVHYACQALARRGIEIQVATTNANGSSKLKVPTDKVVVFEENYTVRYYDDTIIGRFSWSFTVNLWRDVMRASVVHLQDIFSPHAVETLFLAMLKRKPILISPRGAFSSWALSTERPLLKKIWLTLFIRPFSVNARRVVWHATSLEERDEILALFPRGKVHVVPNAINCAEFDRVERLSKEQYIARFFPGCGVTPNKVKLLVCMGRLHRKKSFDVAIEALGLVREAFPQLALLIAGADDGEGEVLRRIVARLGLQGRAALIGEVSGQDKIAYLRGADMFLFPSHSENFGLVCLEALAAGLPVIASRNTPWSEIEAAGCGRWVDNTPSAFSAALSQLLAADLAEMSHRARAHAARYDLATIAASFQKIYEDLEHEHA